MRPPTDRLRRHRLRSAGDRGTSPWWRPLDGGGSSASPSTPTRCRPRGSAVPLGDDRRWTTLAVPGNWTVQGVGDLPHYTNVQMPFDGPPPRLPDRNPTGVYRRTFTVPARLARRARSCCTSAAPRACTRSTSTDGSSATAPTAGWRASTTSRRISSTGRNDLAIVVVRYSAHSYVEDQDQWWMAGLHREVVRRGRGATHIGVTGLRRRVPRRRRRRHARRVGHGRSVGDPPSAGLGGAHDGRDARRPPAGAVR